MKIILEKHNRAWSQKFENLKKELTDIFDPINLQIEHIGSTSIDGLSAKPIIDILVGVEDEFFLDKTVKPMIDHGFIFYELYNEMMPYRRFFVKHNSRNISISNPIKKESEVPRSTEEHDSRLAHIHILKFNSEHWIRHIAFREYLKEHEDVKTSYQKLKENLSHKDWLDGNDYNKAKNAFIKHEESKAVNWFIATTASQNCWFLAS